MIELVLTVSKLLLITDICFYHGRYQKDLTYGILRLALLTVALLVFGVNAVISMVIFILLATFRKGAKRQELVMILGGCLCFFGILFLIGRFELPISLKAQGYMAKNYDFELELLQFVFLMVSFISTKLTHVRQHGAKAKQLSKLEIGILAVYMLSLGASAPFGINTTVVTTQEIFVLLTRSAFFVLLCWICFRTLAERRVQWEEYQQMHEDLLAHQEVYYEALLARETDSQRLRHDLRSHIIALDYLIDIKEYARLKDYIDEGKEKFLVQPSLITNVPLLNVIIKDLFDKAEVSLARLRFEGRFPADFKLTDVDKVILFTNLFKEILAVMQAGPSDSEVHFSVKEISQGLILKLTTPLADSKTCQADVQQSTTMTTQKGLRLKEIQSVIDKYEGKMTYEQVGQVFEFSLFLPKICGELRNGK
jgi:hypothetical protein